MLDIIQLFQIYWSIVGSITQAPSPFTLNLRKDTGNRMKKILCSVCTSKQTETKAILTSIKNRLTKLSQEYVPDFREETEAQSRGPSAFSRLLSLIFEDSNSSEQTILNCSHQKYSRFFRRKLKCDTETFNQLCNELVEKAAQRSYHLENLTLQIKGLSDTCVRLAQTSRMQTPSKGLKKLEHLNTTHIISPNQDLSHGRIGRNQELKVQQQNPVPIFEIHPTTPFMLNFPSFHNYTPMYFNSNSDK